MLYGFSDDEEELFASGGGRSSDDDSSDYGNGAKEEEEAEDVSYKKGVNEEKLEEDIRMGKYVYISEYNEPPSWFRRVYWYLTGFASNTPTTLLKEAVSFFGSFMIEIVKVPALFYCFIYPLMFIFRGKEASLVHTYCYCYDNYEDIDVVDEEEDNFLWDVVEECDDESMPIHEAGALEQTIREGKLITDDLYATPDSEVRRSHEYHESVPEEADAELARLHDLDTSMVENDQEDMFEEEEDDEEEDDDDEDEDSEDGYEPELDLMESTGEVQYYGGPGEYSKAFGIFGPVTGGPEEIRPIMLDDFYEDYYDEELDDDDEDDCDDDEDDDDEDD